MKLKLLAVIANALGIQFKVDGLPYGASYERHCATFGLDYEAHRTGRVSGGVTAK